MMSESNDHLGAPKPVNPEPFTPPLDYGCSQWRATSQTAAGLYDDGARLWRKDDLRDIEQQLDQSATMAKFKVRSINGSMVEIQNPMYDVSRPIWKPYVRFQEYWRLVKSPDGPPGTYLCSYFPDWRNQVMLNFRELIESPGSIFEEKKLCWNKSRSCELLRLRFEELLSTKKVTKIICLGLGDMCRKPPEWFERQNKTGEQELTTGAGGNMMQHSIALTIADVCRNSGGTAIQLLAQDPDYTEQTKEILEREGFEIVGRFGAGGFAEIDEESVVFSAFVAAPVKQIIADIARPALVISTAFEVFNDHEKPWADADSPRTKQMWQEYEIYDFPISSKEAKLMSELDKLKLYVKKE